jgi:hypothetical protein
VATSAWDPNAGSVQPETQVTLVLEIVCGSKPQTSDPVQAAPHEPQLATVASDVQRPPPHEASPAGHWQVPAPQCWSAEQALPQVPQFRGSSARSAHTPSAWHRVAGAVQLQADGAHVQVPATQAAPGAQAFPHAPQSLALERTSWQPSAQASWPGPHAQTPALQGTPVGQAIPQAPQFAASLARAVQNPFSVSGHRSGVAVGQAQVPPPHCSPAARHWTLHAPQWSTAEERS